MKHHKIIRAVTVSMSTIFYVDMIADLQERGYEIVSVSSPGVDLQELKNKGVKCIEVPMERHISIKKDFSALIKLIKVFHQEKPDIVHSMTPKAGLLCMTASWICRVPLRVHTFTGLVWPTATGVKRRLLIFTDWITCACATHIIPEGKGVMIDLQKHVTRKRMRVLGYGNVKGVDMTRFSRRLEIENSASLLRKNQFTFLFVGRVVGDKGINELVEAFIYLMRTNKDVRLFLVGIMEDELDPVSELTKERIKCTPEIQYVGPKLGDELLAYYAASDCFVFPSYREGFPNTVLEAGAMGLPCIVTDINGSREIIEDGVNGIIVPSKDSNALLKAMNDILNNSSKTIEMAKKARPMIESRFEQGYVKKCLLDFYDEISQK